MKTLNFRYPLIAIVAFVSGHFLPTSTAGAAPPTGDQLQIQIQQLQTQVLRLEQTTRTSTTAAVPAATTPSADARIAQLSESVDRILQVLKITNQGVTIESKGNLFLIADKDLRVSGRNKVEIQSDTSLSMNAAGRTDLRGALVAINNGGKPVATKGGKTTGSASTQIITEGSPTVFVP